MEIRPASLSDLNACLAMETSFETDYVWQMEERNNAGNIAVGFRKTRLPRPVRVSGIVAPESIVSNFKRGGMLFVADDGSGVRGFVDVMESEWNQAVSINNLAVASSFRRKGLGSRLMRTVLDWAKQKKSRAILLHVPTKCYPAICLAQKYGFAFCGFNDQLYPNRDIALYFSLKLR
jgi:ribosomal protein S18 acetylase RimI-like enzyme